MLEVVDLSFDYNAATIFQNISVKVERSRILSIVGPNGTGKTTFLKCITGILKAKRGTVLIESRHARRMTHKQLATYIGYVPQSIPVRFPANVFETILAGRRPHISWHPSNKDLDRTAEIIEEMNLTDLAMRDMARLSGGQAQKCCWPGHWPRIRPT